MPSLFFGVEPVEPARPHLLNRRPGSFCSTWSVVNVSIRRWRHQRIAGIERKHGHDSQFGHSRDWQHSPRCRQIGFASEDLRGCAKKAAKIQAGQRSGHLHLAVEWSYSAERGSTLRPIANTTVVRNTTVSAWRDAAIEQSYHLAIKRHRSRFAIAFGPPSVRRYSIPIDGELV